MMINPSEQKQDRIAWNVIVRDILSSAPGGPALTQHLSILRALTHFGQFLAVMMLASFQKIDCIWFYLILQIVMT